MTPAILTKEDLRKAYPFGLLKVAKSKLATYHESSGTEGKPIASYFTLKDWEDIASRFLRSAVDLNPLDTFFIKTPYSMVTTAHQAQKAAEKVGCLIVPGDNRTTLMPYSRVVQLLKDLAVTVTWSLPSEVLYWALAAKFQGLDPKKDFPSLRAFWVAGEALSKSKKKLLQEIWGGIPVYEDYGSTETGSLAGDCKRGKLHAWADRIDFEILNSERVGIFGTGQLLVTTRYREAMPLTRYLIEDNVTLSPSSCDCGSRLPTLEVHGRASSRIDTQGEKFFPKELEEEVYKAGLPFGITLWKANYDASHLEVDFAPTENDSRCALALEDSISKRFGIRTSAKVAALESFVSKELFHEKLQFSKPNYVFRRNP